MKKFKSMADFIGMFTVYFLPQPQIAMIQLLIIILI